MTKIIIGTTPTITYKFKAPFYSVSYRVSKEVIQCRLAKHMRP